MTQPTTPQLSESEVSEIEARANAASPSYCVDWEKGDHALLQAGGWRPANEEQPRTIATFDKDDGYVDLLFCAEARTDIPALIRDWRTLQTRLTACEGSRRVHELDNHHNALACGYCAGPLKNELTRLLSIEPETVTLRNENAALREQLAEAEKVLEGLGWARRNK